MIKMLFTLLLLLSVTISSNAQCDPLDPATCAADETCVEVVGFGFVCVPNSNLPVELISFTARSVDNNVDLNWSTASEENNAGFEVQRSFDGRNFETIDFVEGRGTTSEIQHYRFTDLDITSAAIQTTVYYRLKQIDLNGQFEIFDIAAVELDIEIAQFEITKVIGTRGNTRMINVYFQADERTSKVDVTLVNINSAYIQRNRIQVSDTGMNMIEYDLVDAPDGFYVISINNGKEIITQKFVLHGDH